MRNLQSSGDVCNLYEVQKIIRCCANLGKAWEDGILGGNLERLLEKVTFGGARIAQW